MIHEGLDFLQGELNRLNIRYYPTEANFFLVDVETNADDVFEGLLTKGVIVRSMASYGFSEHIRVNVGLHRENKRLIKALEQTMRQCI